MAGRMGDGEFTAPIFMRPDSTLQLRRYSRAGASAGV